MTTNTNVKPSLIKSIGLITILMAVSKIFSLIREVAIAGFYGASASTDAYFVSGGFVTNIFFGITAALSTVFVPYYMLLKKTTQRKICQDIFLQSSLRLACSQSF